MPFLQVPLRGVPEARQRLNRFTAATFAARTAELATPLVLQALRQFIAVKTGQTRGALDAAASGTHVLGTGNAVAGYLEWGTRPHLIVAHGRALRFVGRDGAVVFRRQVHHPGTHPTLFAEAAAAYVRPQIQAAARQVAFDLLGAP